MGQRDLEVESVSGPALVILAAGRARRFGAVKPLAPIGPNNEAVIDLIASDAVTAGFDHLVLVINNETGPEIRAHVAASWPDNLHVSFAIQDQALGTVHAVLCAQDFIEPTAPFAVSNADDLYGYEAMSLLADHLGTRGSNALVGFHLSGALVGNDPVTRGVCVVEGEHLVSITERRNVTHRGEEFVSDDGLEPRLLEADGLVSMNLWGFAPSMWSVLNQAMALATSASEESEVLLPVAVEDMIEGKFDLSDQALRDVRVLATESRCVGVTHPGDLEIVQEEISKLIRSGLRPATCFATLP
jgi:MobA-like NTP transferase domain